MKEKGIVIFFDRLEDKIRARLSRTPILYAIIGGTGIILFWRGIWLLADELYIGWLVSFVIGVVMLLATGLLVTSFIGDQIIVSGLRKEKKLVDKTESEILAEEVTLKEVKRDLASEGGTLQELKRDLERIKVHIEHIERFNKLDH